MPQKREPGSLKNLCEMNLVRNVERHWLKLKEGAQINKSVDDPESNFGKFVYIISPFESLDSQSIEFILKKLYKMNLFNKNYFCLCLHNRLRYADLSFIKKSHFSAMLLVLIWEIIVL